MIPREPICPKTRPVMALSNNAICRGKPGKHCNSCGWNPDVVARRKQKLRAMANRGRLAEWGL